VTPRAKTDPINTVIHVAQVHPGPSVWAPPPATYAVGVIPQSAAMPCPDGRPAATIFMDDELDSGFGGVYLNGNTRTGWTGSIVQDRDTRFTFCRVDGRQLKPLSSSPDPRFEYAVLKLDAQCPPGSVEFSRYFDNADDVVFSDKQGDWTNVGYAENGNYASGDMGPNVSSGNTRLCFCLFRSGPITMTAFPDFGSMSYGVFAPARPRARQHRD
jgi:hypothetical protein